MIFSSSLLRNLARMALLCGAVSACSPLFDWREVRDNTDGYTVLMPGKPSTHTRPVKLNDLTLDMSMRAVEVNQVMFAVGSVQLADIRQTATTLTFMKNQLLGNSKMISTTDKTSPTPDGRGMKIEVEASTAPVAGQPAAARVFYGRFIARDTHLYQVIMVGPKSSISDEVVETFLNSFKLH
jgi:hypothetical protein